MALSIHTNYASLVTQNQLGKTNSMLSTAMERLGTGLRINSSCRRRCRPANRGTFTVSVSHPKKSLLQIWTGKWSSILFIKSIVFL